MYYHGSKTYDHTTDQDIITDWKRAAHHNITATNICSRGKVGGRVAMGIQGLQRHLYKTQNKIQIVKPNKTAGSAERIRYSVFLSVVESFGGRPPTPADHFVFSQSYYLSPLHDLRWTSLNRGPRITQKHITISVVLLRLRAQNTSSIFYICDYVLSVTADSQHYSVIAATFVQIVILIGRYMVAPYSLHSYVIRSQKVFLKFPAKSLSSPPTPSDASVTNYYRYISS